MIKAAIFLVLVGATACGAGSPTARSETTDDAWLSFASCLRAEGINVGDPIFKADGGVEIPATGERRAPRETFDRAVAACRPILTAAGLKPPGEDRPRENIALEDRALAFARCARAAGHTLPDPIVDGNRVTNWDPQKLDIDLEDPAIQRAADRCAREAGFDPRKE